MSVILVCTIFVFYSDIVSNFVQRRRPLHANTGNTAISQSQVTYDIDQSNEYGCRAKFHLGDNHTSQLISRGRPPPLGASLDDHCDDSDTGFVDKSGEGNFLSFNNTSQQTNVKTVYTPEGSDLSATNSGLPIKPRIDMDGREHFGTIGRPTKRLGKKAESDRTMESTKMKHIAATYFQSGSKSSEHMVFENNLDSIDTLPCQMLTKLKPIKAFFTFSLPYQHDDDRICPAISKLTEAFQMNNIHVDRDMDLAAFYNGRGNTMDWLDTTMQQVEMYINTFNIKLYNKLLDSYYRL